MGGAPGIVQEDGQEADARKAAQGGQLRLPGATAQDLIAARGPSLSFLEPTAP